MHTAEERFYCDGQQNLNLCLFPDCCLNSTGIPNLRQIRALPFYQVFSERILKKCEFPMENIPVETKEP